MGYSLAGVGCTGLGASFFLDWKQKRNEENVAVASARVFNLAICVGKVCASYGTHLILGKLRSDEFSDLETEISRLQDLEAQITMKYAATKYINRDQYKKEIDEVRSKLMDVTGELSEMKQKRLSTIHSISAKSFRDLCMRNRGVYIKLGQHLAQLDYILPEEYCEILRDLLDKNPVSSYDDICGLFKSEFQSEKCDKYHPTDLFAKFEPTPIASASLAQVHIAIGHDGKKYAVKVQHPYLSEQAKGDLVAIAQAMKFVSWLFPFFKYQWLVREMKANLPLELDFMNEAENLKKCSEYLAEEINAGDVVVPSVNAELSTHRILTMSFEEGLSIGDLHRKLVDNSSSDREIGFTASAVAKLISKTFSALIFRHGFVHCDPHEANVHVRPHPTNPRKPQLILLDHGLYRKLDPEFRQKYCRLWNAIVRSDIESIEGYCDALKVKTRVSLFSSLLTMTPWSVIMSNDLSRHQKKREKTATSSKTRTEVELMRSYALRHYHQVSNLLNSLPSDMILLFKTNDCLRHLDSLLGVPVNTMSVIAEVSADVIVREDLQKAITWSDYSRALLQWGDVIWRVGALNLAGYGISFMKWHNQLCTTLQQYWKPSSV